MEVRIAFCTFPDQEVARKIVTEIIDLRLAACGNIVPQVHSIYRWEGKVESNDESLAIFKLDAAHYPAFETKLRELHPYDVPEIVAIEPQEVNAAYAKWVGHEIQRAE